MLFGFNNLLKFRVVFRLFNYLFVKILHTSADVFLKRALIMVGFNNEDFFLLVEARSIRDNIWITL